MSYRESILKSLTKSPGILDAACFESDLNTLEKEGKIRRSGVGATGATIWEVCGTASELPE